MKSVLLAFGLITIAGLHSLPASPNLKNGVAIQGYDPVSYFAGNPSKGSAKFSHKAGGATYHFASEANLDTFRADPSKYQPVSGGWCAYAMLEGDKVKVDPKTYKVIDGRLYLYYNGIAGNTLKKWNSLAASQPESDIVKKVDRNWSKISGS